LDDIQGCYIASVMILFFFQILGDKNNYAPPSEAAHGNDARKPNCSLSAPLNTCRFFFPLF